MKHICYILIIIICFSCKNIKEDKTILTVDVAQDIVVPKQYIVTKINEQLSIDGQANENSWDSAIFTDNFIDIEGDKISKFDTKVKMLWDDINLYVYAELQEPHIWANLKQRDTIIFYNNDFEVFLDPSGNAESYGEIEINALNTVWDLSLNKPYRVGGDADFTWNLDSLKSAVKIHGTLNNPNDLDSLWSVEMAIPLKPIIELKNKAVDFPKEGEQWRINFSRVEWDFDIINGNYYRKKKDNNYLKEYNWVWSSQKVINMHEPEKWGYLQFTEAQNSKDIQFIKDKDLLIKQAAFAVFRKTKFGDLKQLLDNEVGFKQPIDVRYFNDKLLKTIFTKTTNGFEYKFESPITHYEYSINNEGILKEL